MKLVQKCEYKMALYRERFFVVDDWETFCSIHFQLCFLSCIMDDACLLHHCLLILIRVPSLLNYKTGGSNENVSEVLRDTCWLKYRLHLWQVSLIVIVVTAGTHKQKHFFFLIPLSTIRLTCPYASTCTCSFMPITTEEVGGFWEEVAVAELQRHGELFLEM